MTSDTATLSECLDYIAEAMGWKTKKWNPMYDDDLQKWVYPPDQSDEPVYYREVDGKRQARSSNPVGTSLDAIAASLPPGWWWDHIEFSSKCVVACAFAVPGEGVGARADGHDLEAMKLAMARCSAKAWAAGMVTNK